MLTDMHNDDVDPTQKRDRTVIRTLIQVSWTLWGVLMLFLLYMLVRVSTEGRGSPEAGPGLGIFAVLFVMMIMALLAWFLVIASRKQSTGGVITILVLLTYPLVMLVAQPVVRAYKEWSWANEEARNGAFGDATLKSMAQAIAGNDTLTLKQLLNGKAPPEGKDRAGNDLLAYALYVVRDKKGSAGPVRILLDAGADPNRSRTADGGDLVNFMVFGGSPAARESLRLLLEHGADPNAVDPQGETPIRHIYNEHEILRALVDHGADIDRIQPDGVPAIVHLISTRQWDSALYLIEKGAKLDIVNANGLSVDYYLNDWKESVYGEHPAGWDSVRAAIEKRRASAR